MAQRKAAATNNNILARLPYHEYQLLASWLEPVTFMAGDVVSFAGRPMDTFYFVTEGIVSLSSATSHGESIEIAMVGSEGVLGLCSLFEDKSVPLNKTAQSKVVHAQRVPINRMKQLLDDCSTLRGSLCSFMFKQMMQISQNMVCSHFHSVEQQLCKWILLREKRLNGVVHVTQDKIAQMLGVRRAGINVVLRHLQTEGLIICKRGVIEVTDRLGLHNMACECFSIIQSDYDRLLDSEKAETA